MFGVAKRSVELWLNYVFIWEHLMERVMEPREYPDPAERYEHLHREEKEYEDDYDFYLEDEDE